MSTAIITLRESQVVAHSLEYNISAVGIDPQQSLDKLAGLIQAHVSHAKSEEIDLDMGNKLAYDLLGKYYAIHHKDPTELRSIADPDLVAYDLTNPN